MSDDYEIVGYIVRPKTGDGCAGCLGALIILAIIGVCIESCNGGKNSSGNTSRPQQAVSSSVMVQAGMVPERNVAVDARMISQSATPVYVAEQRIRCRHCSGKGIKNIWTTCPTCNGHRKVVDQARSVQSSMYGIGNGLARGRYARPPRRHTYYMSCPTCNAKGKIANQARCGQCGGNGFLFKRE